MATVETWFLADGASRTDKKKAVLSVGSEEEIESITVCPMWGIRAKVAVGKIDPYFYQKVGSKAPSF